MRYVRKRNLDNGGKSGRCVSLPWAGIGVFAWYENPKKTLAEKVGTYSPSANADT